MERISVTERTVSALLFENEKIVYRNENVGIYLNKDKDKERQLGQLYLTNLRLIYLDRVDSLSNSFALQLKHINKTEHFNGFLKSSPKVTIHFSASKHHTETIITCSICSYKNSSTNHSCQLCGVKLNNVGSTDGPSADSSLSHSTTCRACTFDNHPAMSRCEICGESLISSEASSSLDRDDIKYIRISFRSGNDSQFYEQLSMTLNFKAWADSKSHASSSNPAGIDGIIKAVDSQSMSNQSHLDESFKDLNTLFFKADELLKTAQQLAKSTPRQSEDINYFLTSSFNSLTLDNDIKHDSQSSLHKDELITCINGLFAQDERSMITLDTIWCAWNRSRGLALISPQTLLDTLPQVLETTDVSLLKLLNGITVLHKSQNSLDQFNRRIVSYCRDQSEALTLMKIAQFENLSPTLVGELLQLALLNYADILKDVTSEGQIEYTLNMFSNYL